MKPSENKVKINLQDSEISTRNALGVIDRTIDFISAPTLLLIRLLVLLLPLQVKL